MRTAEWRDAAPGFHLAEPAVIGGDNDVARQHQFDADSENDALHGGDDRLLAALLQTECVDIALLEVSLLGGGAEEFRHVEAGGEILAFGADHADPTAVVVVEFGQGVGQLLHHRRRERVFLGGVVDDDLENAIMGLGANFSFGAHDVRFLLSWMSRMRVRLRAESYLSYFTASAVRIAVARSGEKCDAPCSSRSRNDNTPPREPQLPSSMMRKLIHQAGEGAFIPQASASAAWMLRMTFARSPRVQQQSIATTSITMTSLGLSESSSPPCAIMSSDRSVKCT